MKYLLILPLALFTCCKQRPYDICDAALDGVDDPRRSIHVQCRADVTRAGYQAEHTAANKYRNLPR